MAYETTKAEAALLKRHEHLLSIMRVLPSDYADYGGSVVRWQDSDADYPDCSCGCRWAEWLKGSLDSDWCVCTNPASPRAGLLTFEHMTGQGCFEENDVPDDRSTADAPVAVPLTELLRSIPPTARLIVESDWKSSTVWPVGVLAHSAADEIERLQASVASRDQIIARYRAGRNENRSPISGSASDG